MYGVCSKGNVCDTVDSVHKTIDFPLDPDRFYDIENSISTSETYEGPQPVQVLILSKLSEPR